VATYLDEILVAHRRAAAQDDRDLGALERLAAATAPPRGMAQALRSPGLSVIAEIKRRSPSKGDLAPDLDPTDLAVTYASAGAAALSVLTDEAHFGGSLDDLEAARRAVSIPVLRKDFTVAHRDVLDARIHGADAILLIVAALDDRELVALHRAGSDLSLDVLVEVHDEVELDRALEAGATIIGVNQRDLHSFAVDTECAERVIRGFPPETLAVAESGVRDGADAERLARAGFDAILVGEHLLTAADPAQALSEMRGHAVRDRTVAGR
jgi:indole-3-glycerol phosphate synthase